MKKNKIRHYKTLKGGMFHQAFPHAENGGETLAENQPTLDKTWKWLGDPDDY